MGNIIRLGDTSTHGGILVTSSVNVFVNGIGVVRLFDIHCCPIPGHGCTPMVTASPDTTANSRNICRTGDLAACGAAAISGSPNTSVNL